MDMNQLINSFVEAFADQIAQRVLAVVTEEIDTKIQQAADSVALDVVELKARKFMENYDFSDLINEAIENEDLEAKVERAVDNYDIEQAVKNAISDMSFTVIAR